VDKDLIDYFINIATFVDINQLNISQFLLATKKKGRPAGQPFES